MPTIFSRVIRGEIPCHKILEDDRYFAFLDLKPIREGHALVIPKKETDYFFDLDDETLAGLMVFAKKVAAAIKKAVPCKKVGVMVAGLEVRHAHVHLVPIEEVKDLDFGKAKPDSDEDLAETAAKIRKAL